MILYLIYICIFYFICFCCEKDFDDAVKPVDTIIQVKVYGYENLKNRGVIKGCCGNVTNQICEPCRMMIVIYENGYSYYSHSYKPKLTTIALFSRASETIFENYEKSFLHYSSRYAEIKVQVYTDNLNKTVQEEFPRINAQEFTIYRYIGSYGVNNVLKLWTDLKLKPISLFKEYNSAMIRIDSIYFKEYRDSEGECCGEKQDVECMDECSYNIEWQVSNYFLEKTNNLLPIDNTRQQNISSTITSNSELLFREKFDYSIRMFSNKYNLIDSIIVENISDLPNVEYSLLNLVGVYGNVIFNISWMHNCQIYGGINCKTDCIPAYGSQYCDLYSNIPKCMNGASDENTCINLTTKCNQDICSNGGTCLNINGKLKCNCHVGFTGEHCQEWQCDDGCNENGLCIGPNMCKCYHNYTGKHCEEFPCDEEGAKKCGRYGIKVDACKF